MSGFLQRMSGRARGEVPVVVPVVRSRYEPDGGTATLTEVAGEATAAPQKPAQAPQDHRVAAPARRSPVTPGPAAGPVRAAPPTAEPNRVRVTQPGSRPASQAPPETPRPAAVSPPITTVIERVVAASPADDARPGPAAARPAPVPVAIPADAPEHDRARDPGPTEPLRHAAVEHPAAPPARVVSPVARAAAVPVAPPQPQPQPRPAPGTQPPAPVIEVTIGRVEVVARPAPAHPATPAAPVAVGPSLEDYLAERSWP